MPHRGSSTRLRPVDFQFQNASDFWLRLIGYTAIAGAVYGAFIALVAGVVVGLLWAGFVAGFFAPPFMLAVRSITGRWRHPWAAPLFGGTVGFVATFPVWSSIQDPGDFPAFFWAPMTTTLLGEIAGYLAARPYLDELEIAGGRKWRFSIRSLLIATCWIAAVLALLRATGALDPGRVRLLVWWLMWQSALFAVVILLSRRALQVSREATTGRSPHVVESAFEAKSST